MSDTAELPTPATLWKGLSDEHKRVAAEAFWRDGDAVVEHAEAIAAIAQRIKFRAKSVVAMPPDKKATYLLNTDTSQLVAARLLVAYHLDKQRPMMRRFLDLLEIAHDDGLITAGEVSPPDASKLEEVTGVMVGEFPHDDVLRYFSTLLWQDPDTWGALSDTAAYSSLIPS